MTSLLALVGLNLAVTLGCMLLLWALSVRLHDPSFIDAWWPIGFVVVAWVSFVGASGDPARMMWLTGLSTVWGLRLGIYLFWRWRRNGPDRRYVSMLRHAPGDPRVFTLTRVFLLQGVLLWTVSLPLQVGQWYDTPEGLRAAGFVGIACCVLGIAFETIGDLQLARFKSNPANDRRVLDRGLWRYTRHPNYFGDACVWWGLFLVALVNPITALTVISPCVMTLLLARWSGVGPLERGLKRHRPDYTDYIARTSGFVPLPPRRRASTTSTPSTIRSPGDAPGA